MNTIKKEVFGMRQIVSHLWFDKEAEEAAKFYTTVFDHSEIIRKQEFKDTPSGDAQSVSFRLENLTFSAINGGPFFKINPSISIMVSLSEASEVNNLYTKLAEGGQDLMPLDSYPFSERYAWFEDKYGLSWQLTVDENHVEDQRLRVNLLFSDQACGLAEDALNYYLSVFEGSKAGHISHYSEGEAQDKRAQINYSELNIKDQQLVLMDHGAGGDFNFNEGYSLMLLCGSQAEIDYYWDKLSHVPESEQCGWVKDKFGISWQIVPVRLYELIEKSTPKEQERVTQAMLKMKKLDIEALENAKYFE